MPQTKANHEAIKALRVRSGIRPSELAQTAGIGRVTLWRIEEGKQNPHPDTLKRIADALGVPVTAILTAREVAA